MLMLETISFVIVLVAGLYLVALGALALALPDRATRFLLGFASTARLHYLELAVRLAVGGAFLVHAPKMHFSEAFGAFGWVLLATTLCILAAPWRWHSRFAQYAVPIATQYIKMIGISSLVLGCVILLAIGIRFPE